MATAPEYGGQQIAPQVGTGTQGASFQAMEAPKTDFSAPDMSPLAKYLEDINEAIATDADTQLTQYQQELLYDKQTGFMGRKGYDAVRADDEGVSPLDSMMKRFKGAVDAVCVGKTASQQKLIRAKATGLTNSLYATGLQHAFQENHNYMVNAAQASIKQQAVVAANHFDASDVIKGCITKAKANAARVARLTGMNVKQAQIDAEAGIHHNVVMGYINAAQNNPTNWAKAQEYLRGHSQQMTPDDVFAFDAHINTGMRKFESYQVADEVHGALSADIKQYERASGRLSAGDTGYVDGDAAYLYAMGLRGDQYATDADGRAMVRESKRGGETAYGAGGVTKTMADKALGRVLTDAEWKAVREDPMQNAKIAQGYLNRLGVEFGDTNKALAAYLGSPKEVAAAEAKAKKDGGVWTQYLPKETQSALNGVLKRMQDARDVPMKDADGNEISAFDSRYGTTAFRMPTEEQIRKLVEQNPLSVNPEWKEDTIRRTLAKFESDKRDFAAQQQTALDYVCQLVEQGQEPTEADLAKLDYKTLKDFKDWRRKHDANDPTGDRGYFAYLVKNPSVVHEMSEAGMRDATRKLPKAGRQMIMKEWEAGQLAKQGRLAAEVSARNGGNPLGKTAATMELVTRVLKRNESFAKLDVSQQALVASEIMLGAAADNAIYGIDTSDTVKAEAYVLDLIKKTYNSDGLWGTYGSDKKPLVAFKWNDHDSWTKNVGRQLAQRYYHTAVGGESKEQAMSMILRVMIRRDPGVDCTGILTDKEKAEATDIIRAAIRNSMSKASRYGGLSQSDFNNELEAKVARYAKDEVNLLKAFLEDRMQGDVGSNF